MPSACNVARCSCSAKATDTMLGVVWESLKMEDCCWKQKQDYERFIAGR